MDINCDCPCKSGKKYGDCCHLAHSGKRPAVTAEALMRSRFSAYVLRIADYIIKTTHPKFREEDFKENIQKWMNQTRWTHLEILDLSKGLVHQEIGEVEFVAEFFLEGQSQILHERSNFVKYKGRWVYTEGKISPK
ncbi:MAG: YchJ family metal-binding protein [bacterium]|nr:YchJ family metal-binding protein [bacterium]|tara:strand:+ start:264 stop:671 length:408 start_codon:yes stop_codon:yes gene_type:complete